MIRITLDFCGFWRLLCSSRSGDAARTLRDVVRASLRETAYAARVTMASEAQSNVAPQTPRVNPFAVLFAPDRAMQIQALVGRARFYFLFAWLCSISLGAALAVRVDARSATLQKLEMTGQLKTMSDRQIDEETTSAERVSQVKSVALGVVSTPVDLGLFCVSVLALSWFFRGRLKGSAVVPVASTALVPGAFANIVDIATALRHTTLPPQGVELGPRTLTQVMAIAGRPLMGPATKFGNALDFYSLWAAVLLGYGVAAAGQMPKRRAVIGTLVAWVCFRLLTNVAINR